MDFFFPANRRVMRARVYNIITKNNETCNYPSAARPTAPVRV